MSAIKYIEGDILTAKTDAILQQVNCRGVMGAGLAKQIRTKYPYVYNRYLSLCNEHVTKPYFLLGRIQVITPPSCEYDVPTIVNLFAQDRYGRDRQYTDYDAMRECFRRVNERFAGDSVAIPYGIGCGLAGGDWDIVLNMIEKELTKCDISIYRFQK